MCFFCFFLTFFFSCVLGASVVAPHLLFPQRLVKSPEIKAKFGFRGRVASGRSESEYNDELSRHTLRTFLKLVLFLDRAKVHGLLLC